MYRSKFLVSNSHVNNKLLMKDVSIVNSIQDVEGLHIDSLTTFNNYLQDNNLGVFLLYRQIDILNRPAFGADLEISTYPYNTSSIGGYRHIYIKDENDKVLIQTNSFGAFVNLDTYLPERIPKEVVASIKDGLKDDNVENLPRKIKYDSSNKKLIDTFNIRKSHIDRYNHVNNAYYIEFALDAIKEEFNYNRIRAEYKKSFQLNDLVKIYLIDHKNDIIVIELANEDEEICAIIEFSTFI